MNPNSVENHLEQWKPRSPSPEIRARLFTPPLAPAAPVRQDAWVEARHWLVPALGCFLLLLASANPRFGGLALNTSGATNFLAGESAEVTFRGRALTEQNNVVATTVEFSLSSNSTSTSRSILPFNTNNFIW